MKEEISFELDLYMCWLVFGLCVFTCVLAVCMWAYVLFLCYDVMYCTFEQSSKDKDLAIELPKTAGFQRKSRFEHFKHF